MDEGEGEGEKREEWMKRWKRKWRRRRDGRREEEEKRRWRGRVGEEGKGEGVEGREVDEMRMERNMQ